MFSKGMKRKQWAEVWQIVYGNMVWGSTYMVNLKKINDIKNMGIFLLIPKKNMNIRKSSYQ